MAYTTNNAIGTNDFLDKIKVDLIANNWALLDDRIATTRELYFKNVNTDVVASFKVVKSSNIEKGDTGWFENIVLNSPTIYSSGLSFYNQTGGIPVANSGVSNLNLPAIPSYDLAMKYALFINDNRIIISYKISSFTASAYIGKIKTFSSPIANPHPVYVGGSCLPNSVIENTNRQEWGIYIFSHNRTDKAGSYYFDGTTWGVIKSYPYQDIYDADYYQEPIANNNYVTSAGTPSRMLDNTDGTIKTDSIKIITPKGWAGELDGIYLINTKLVNSFDTANIASSGKDCIIFNNITQNSKNSFFGVEK